MEGFGVQGLWAQGFKVEGLGASGFSALGFKLLQGFRALRFYMAPRLYGFRAFKAS